MEARRIVLSFRRILGQTMVGRVAAWACIVVVGALSLVPADQVTRTTLGGHAEHVLAYAMTAFIAAAAYSERKPTRIGAALIAYAGVLEFLQIFSPGRNARFEDFMFSGAGVILGVAAAVFLGKLRTPRARDFPDPL